MRARSAYCGDEPAQGIWIYQAVFDGGFVDYTGLLPNLEHPKTRWSELLVS
jgi:hypothetical protein